MLHKKKFELIRYDLVTTVNNMESKKYFDITEAFMATLFSIRAHYSHGTDRLNSSSKSVNEINQMQHQLRAAYREKLNSSDQRRCELVSEMDMNIERILSSVRSTVSLSIVDSSSYLIERKSDRRESLTDRQSQERAQSPTTNDCEGVSLPADVNGAPPALLYSASTANTSSEKQQTMSSSGR